MGGHRQEKGGHKIIPIRLLSTLTSFQVRYSLRVTTDDPAAMHQPSLNVSHSGSLPSTPETLRIGLPCTGVKASAVLVTVEVTINVEGEEQGRSYEIR